MNGGKSIVGEGPRSLVSGFANTKSDCSSWSQLALGKLSTVKGLHIPTPNKISLKSAQKKCNPLHELFQQTCSMLKSVVIHVSVYMYKNYWYFFEPKNYRY